MNTIGVILGIIIVLVLYSIVKNTIQKQYRKDLSKNFQIGDLIKLSSQINSTLQDTSLLHKLVG